MKINWLVRLKSKTFWMTMIPALLVLIKQVGGIFGLDVDFSALQDQLLSVVGTVFMLLAVLGIITDHTTEGISDSEQALTYDTPKTDKEA